jgi:hypothetical protein
VKSIVGGSVAKAFNGNFAVQYDQMTSGARATCTRPGRRA